MQISEVKDLLQQILYLYPHMDMTKEAAVIWSECLQDFNYIQARENLIKYAKKNQFAPTVADIRGVTNSHNVLKTHINNYCEVTGRTYEFFVPPKLSKKPS